MSDFPTHIIHEVLDSGNRRAWHPQSKNGKAVLKEKRGYLAPNEPFEVILKRKTGGERNKKGYYQTYIIVRIKDGDVVYPDFDGEEWTLASVDELIEATVRGVEQGGVFKGKFIWINDKGLKLVLVGGTKYHEVFPETV